MLSNFHILTISHQETELEQLPAYGIAYKDENELRSKLLNIKEEHNLEELYYLSTCNRILFLMVTEQKIDNAFIGNFFRGKNNKVLHLQGEKAIFYLFQVASSIHSMVVGERQIITQIRTAYEQQVEWSLTGDNVRLAIQQTIRAAKRVYAETRIGEKPVSVVSLAIKKILDFQLPKSSSIILVGAGQTNKLVLSHLLKKGFLNISVYNRTLAKASELVEKTQGQAGTLEDLRSFRGSFDCLIACTGASEPTISMEVADTLAKGMLSEKIWVDLGLPGDIDSSVHLQWPDRVVNLSNLQATAKTNLGFRKGEIKKADILLRGVLENFKQLIYRRRIERAFHQIPIEIKSIKNKAILEVFKSDVERMDDRTKEVVNRMMDYMEKRCISVPMKAAKEASL